jgi:hypothetical protein
VNPAPPETPLALRFAAALASAEPGRARISIETYTSAFAAAEPGLATSTERRARLAAAIRELTEAGILSPSRGADRSELPALPRFVVLLDRSADPPVGREAAAYSWRPELAWAARLPLRRSEFDALRAIQAYLRDRAPTAPVVPTGERSLELFGNEKRLDTLRRNRRLFAKGRLSLEMLRAHAYAPPFAYRRIGTGSVALVLENVATYHSVLATVPANSPVGLVIFGSGGNFAASVAYLAELAKDGPAAAIREIRYFGDLDCRGLEIPIAADAAARKSGLGGVRPAIALWAMLLRAGRRAPSLPVDSLIIERLVSWLPLTLRAESAKVLAAGYRLAQEAVGMELLANDSVWATWAGLGPPGLERTRDPGPASRGRSTVTVTGESRSIGGPPPSRMYPAELASEVGNSWIAAGETRNWIVGDPLLDWLERHGTRAGFRRDDEREQYDPRTDFRRFLLEKSSAFEAGVLRLLKERTEVLQIASSDGDARSPEKAHATLEALRSGVPVVFQAVLRNPARGTIGVVDLLVRSDLLASWFPELLSWEEASRPAPALGLSSFHYRPVEVKFHTFELTSDGHVSAAAEELASAVQVWLHADALGHAQGYVPSAAYLLGRTWQERERRGEGCLERLARVDLDRWLPNREAPIDSLAADAIAWLRRLDAHGEGWQVLPVPSVPELYPHARNADDAPWHFAKREIAERLGELTLLPGMNPRRRAAAHAMGMKSWRDPVVSAARLGITAPTYAARTDAVLAANRSEAPVVLPERLLIDSAWRSAAPVEFYVDFETVSNLDDDFSRLPQLGGQPLIVQIGCGQITSDGCWSFGQWTVDEIAIPEERRIIDAWIGYMQARCEKAAFGIEAARIYHWSAAEPVNLESAYTAARNRQPDASWPSNLPWFDVLDQVIRAEPVAVTGSFNFGLKSVAKAMQAAGLTTTVWSDGPTDGLGAMVGTWFAARESRRAGCPLSTHPLIVEIARYNEIDCRAIAEVLFWLRAHR